ncbi:helix-turn-helix domain-containing protein [Mycobacterium avium]|uniref:helix-turn-helix domain-containing protein n=1 Tax=Mycobacterium avium TaxID=1764 RepID=UPI0007A06A55|nr:helix-turn-helix domain-containing protein [Mycobacterium avium]
MPTTDTDARLASVTPEQIAYEYLLVHPNTVYKLLRGRAIPSYRVGRQWRVRVADLEEFMADGGAA